MSDVVTTVPGHHRAYAGAVAPVEDEVGRLGLRLQHTLDTFAALCPEGGFPPGPIGEAIHRHASGGRTLAEWVAGIGESFGEIDAGLPAFLRNQPQTLPESTVLDHTEAVGMFPTLALAESWHRGRAEADAIQRLIAAGEGQQASDRLTALADLVDDPVAMQAAWSILGDLDALEDRIDAATDRGGILERVVGGAVDSIVGTADTLWGLTGQFLYDPAGWLGNMGDLGEGLWWAATNLDELGGAIVDWEGFKEDPWRWLGSQLPDLAMAIATGGAAAAVAKGTTAARSVSRALRTATRLADRVGSLRTLARTLPDRLATRAGIYGVQAMDRLDDVGDLAASLRRSAAEHPRVRRMLDDDHDLDTRLRAAAGLVADGARRAAPHVQRLAAREWDDVRRAGRAAGDAARSVHDRVVDGVAAWPAASPIDQFDTARTWLDRVGTLREGARDHRAEPPGEQRRPSDPEGPARPQRPSVPATPGAPPAAP